ncbi:PREDICTED: high-affinity zinc uptake system binding-protein ZnuA-like, partial [Cyphomyrmex costatus]|uniref:high-affinity zinc uptake system binding-protein ZnuA-like n=1 Tax=Cyphomyrmex costatus TaxID=456900 RepID=UPI00085230F9
LLLAGCSGGSDGATDRGREISIVASTNAYGDIAKAVVGDRADVTSIITSRAQNPHEYEATTRDRLAIEQASVVVQNGAGYDSFMTTLVATSDADPVVVTATGLSGLLDIAPTDDHDHGGHAHAAGLNEHVWYDLDTAAKVAEELCGQMTKLDADNALSYRKNYRAFAHEVDELRASASDLKKSASGKKVATIESVPLYLLQRVGLVNRTPSEFGRAEEEGSDVPPQELQRTLDLFTDEKIELLAYNRQTATGTTKKVRAAAVAADVRVVDFSETLPDDKSYIEWMQGNLDNIAAALVARGHVN